MLSFLVVAVVGGFVVLLLLLFLRRYCFGCFGYFSGCCFIILISAAVLLLLLGFFGVFLFVTKMQFIIAQCFFKIKNYFIGYLRAFLSSRRFPFYCEMFASYISQCDIDLLMPFTISTLM